MNFSRSKLRIVFAFAVSAFLFTVSNIGLSKTGVTATTSFYRLVLLNDPATTMTIGYSAPEGSRIKETKVYYGTKDMGTDPRQYQLSAAPNSTNTFVGLQNYYVDLKNLTPNTNYYFVVTADASVSKRFWFKTAPATSQARLSLVVGGDSRTNRVPRQQANALVSRLRPHAVVFGGDYTSSGTASQWAEWMTDWQLTTGADGRMIPIIPARGNHESSNAIMEKLFHTPAGVYFGLTFADNLLRIYTLNSEAPIKGLQTDWLAADLKANLSATWKMAQYHRPMKPHTAGKVGNTASYDSWAKLFFSAGMNIVSEADAHTVKRTWPIRPDANGVEGFTRDDVQGATYIGEGCWGAPLRPNNAIKPWTRDSGKFNQFSWIFVDKNKTEIRTVVVGDPNKVAQVSDADIFIAPAGLNLWQPSAGAVVTLPSRRAARSLAQASR